MRVTSSQPTIQPRPRLGVLAGALAVTAACGFLFAGAEAGGDIRGDLSAGAERLASLPQAASAAQVRDALKRALIGRAVSIDAADFPASVAVTIHDVDHRHCVAAERRARRLEGDVVVELDGYRSPRDCTAGNDMTWRFMP